MKSKRILIVTDWPVWPPINGAASVIWARMNNLRRLGHEVSLLGLGLEKEAVELLAAHWGAGIHGIPQVRFRAEKPLFQGLKRTLLNKFYVRGIGSPRVDHWFWPYMERGVAEFSARHQFDVVIVEQIFVSKALLYFGPEVLKIVDTQDVWTLRREKFKALHKPRFRRYITDAAEEVRGLERADVVIGIQENESIFFRKLMNDSRPVVTVGHTATPRPLPLPVNSDILFVGSPYQPNRDGLMHFLQACLPGIREVVPKVRVLVAGTICHSWQRNLPGVELLGAVEDVASAYGTAAIVINPVRIGTGLKTKNIEALAFGRALVTTPCGADGLEPWAGEAFRVARDDAQFSSAVVELLTNRQKLESLAAAGLKFAGRWNEMQIDALKSILAR